MGDGIRRGTHDARRAALWALAAVAAVAVGCGGGGTSQPPTEPPPVQPPPPPPPPDTGFKFGTPGPWAVENRTYGASDGIRETPVVGFTTDEAQNRWIATPRALYVFRPAKDDKTPPPPVLRFDQRDGLHFDPDLSEAGAVAAATSGNPSFALYCNENPMPQGATTCAGASNPRANNGTPTWGGGFAPGILTIVGGAKNEVFVGYYGTEPVLDPVTGDDKADPGRHLGKVDRVRLKDDGTISVDRLDLVANNHGLQFWHDRTIYRLAYDHLVHKHTLYAGTNHGVTLLQPDRFVPFGPADGLNTWINAWMGDHLHAHVCVPGPCDPNSSAGQRMGGWRGLALDANGAIWHAGDWTAGRITYDDDPANWVARNGAAFTAAFGDPYPNGGSADGFQNEPVFKVPKEGDYVNLSGAAVCPDGRVWFSSTGPTGRPETVAVWNGRAFQTWPATALGAGANALNDVVCLPDGRVVLATQDAGLAIYDPATGASKAIRAGAGIPDDGVVRLDLDTMASPPALHVATRGGAAVIRVFPK